MKKLICVTLVLLLMLCGCSVGQNSPTTGTTAGTTAATAAPTQENSAPAPTTGETVPPTTAAPTEPVAQGYLQKVINPDLPVFNSPSNDGTVVATVGQAGTYTIVEEAADSEGNTWGKLKSGLGWINVTQARRELESTPVITCAYGDMAKLPAQYHSYDGVSGEAHIPVIFHAYEKLTDFTISAGWWDGMWHESQKVYSLAVLDAEKPLVAQLSFPGDMSMYCISFTDADGLLRIFLLSESGRTNILEFHET